MKVAVDAMGGDKAPEVVVQGAVESAEELGVDITLVGDGDVITGILGPHYPDDHIMVHHCHEVVGMSEPPLMAVRKKRNSSISVAFDLVRRGEADAVVSAGNSGATLAAGVLTLGRLDGVDRPAIAGIIPAERGSVVLIDVGANVDCRPAHLFQFGLMAQAFASACLHMEDPKVGLLSIGEEGGKGNEQVLLARPLFEESKLNFVGNVEGRHISTGEVEVIVCDGFVGNVALKLAEGLAGSLSRLVENELNTSFLWRVGRRLGLGSLERLKGKLDYEEYGGAPLLGINGVGIICHGESSAKSLRNAIRLAVSYVNNRVLEKMTLKLKAWNGKSTSSRRG
ncbi:MAG: phosphate acyltransferase PlsX [Pseudomonadota bacterium]